MDPKTCVDSYDSQRSVHLHRVDKVRWSRRVCTTSQKMLKIFKVNVYHFTATKTSETVSVKQYEHDRVTRCTFSVDFKEIKTISQSLPSTYAICLQPRQWASYQIREIAGCACARNAGNVFPHCRFQRKPLVSDPGMHHGTCVTHVPWCMSGSLTCGDGENVPGIPGACAPAILRIWQEAHAAVTEERLELIGYLEPWIFEYEFRDVFFLKMYGIPDKHLWNDI